MNGNGNQNDYRDTDFDRNGYRGRRRNGYGRYNDDYDDLSYGGRAMGGRDYSTSGRYFDEGDRYGRYRKYGAQSHYPYSERRYNTAGYGGGRTQSDFYMRGDYDQRGSEGGRWGYAPSDDYRREGYGQYDRDADRDDYGRAYTMRDYHPSDRIRNRSRYGWNTYDQNRRGYESANQYGGQAHFTDEGYANDFRSGQFNPKLQTGYGEFAGWSNPGPHTGRGPKGYERTPDRMREEVCERLTRHGGIDASDIEVKVETDEVTLTGTVDSRQAKRMAEDVAEDVAGVKDVHNQLRINRTDAGRNAEQQNKGQENKNTRNPRRASQQT
ncbi:MAG TPA: BON domain-containing protein [Rhodothermales bacterium]|nr:BON domain-containing protein [Rhodothermales bacterium]